MAVNIKNLSETYPITYFKDTPKPTWGEDAGRNTNSGKFSGTFVGYFTNLHIEVGPMDETQMKNFKALFEVPIIEDVTFPNSSNGGVDYTEDFYGTSLAGGTKNWDSGKIYYEGFSFDLVAVNKRNDI
jgi:hypothetical protein